MEEEWFQECGKISAQDVKEVSWRSWNIQWLHFSKTFWKNWKLFEEISRSKLLNKCHQDISGVDYLCYFCHWLVFGIQLWADPHLNALVTVSDWLCFFFNCVANATGILKVLLILIDNPPHMRHYGLDIHIVDDIEAYLLWLRLLCESYPCGS